MKLFDSIRNRVNSSLETDKEPSGKAGRVESSLGRGIGSEGGFSWGMLILAVAAVYALVRLVIIILHFFG